MASREDSRRSRRREAFKAETGCDGRCPAERGKRAPCKPAVSFFPAPGAKLPGSSLPAPASPPITPRRLHPSPSCPLPFPRSRLLGSIPRPGCKVSSYRTRAAMKLTVPFFGSSSPKQQSGKVDTKRSARASPKDAGGKLKSGSFGSTTSSDDAASAVTTPRTVLPPAARRPPAVTREDLEVALRRVVASEAELAAVLAEADAAGLALEEVDAAAGAGDEADLRDAFAVFDADGDGRISAEELLAVLASLGDHACSVDDCRRMIRGVDADGDGFVCFDEFSRMMTHGP